MLRLHNTLLTIYVNAVQLIASHQFLTFKQSLLLLSHHFCVVHSFYINDLKKLIPKNERKLQSTRKINYHRECMCIYIHKTKQLK